MSKSPRVLIVDDDMWLIESVVRNLQKELGGEVKTASNGIEAIEILDTFHPDVIVLDMFMPGPNGIVLLHELQSHDDLADIPVIICSNSASDVVNESLEQYGVVRVVDKATMHPEDLVVAIRKAVA